MRRVCSMQKRFSWIIQKLPAGMLGASSVDGFLITSATNRVSPNSLTAAELLATVRAVAIWLVRCVCVRKRPFAAPGSEPGCSGCICVPRHSRLDGSAPSQRTSSSSRSHPARDSNLSALGTALGAPPKMASGRCGTFEELRAPARRRGVSNKLNMI